MENEFSCKICFEKYDVTYRKPTILMLCAHTICNICLKGLKNYECPTCRDEIISTKPNFALIEQLEITLNNNSGKFLTIFSKFYIFTLKTSLFERYLIFYNEKNNLS